MDTLLLTRQDVAALLRLDEHIAAVEEAFKLHAEGKGLPPKVMGIHTQNGGFHIKAGILNLNKTYFVAKINSNFQYDMNGQGLPLIQGLIVACDEENGRPLADVQAEIGEIISRKKPGRTSKKTFLYADNFVQKL